MARQQLIADIHNLDQLLATRQHNLRLSGEQRMARLRRASPLWLVGGGIAAGLLAGRLASRRTTSAAHRLGAASLSSWLLGGIRLWQLSGPLLSGAGGSAVERDA